MLLNRYANTSEESIHRKEAREGFYRPTICCDEINFVFFTTMINVIKRELGSDFENSLISVIPSLIPVGHPTKKRFVAVVEAGIVEKIRTPHYSGGVTPISECEAMDIIEVPVQGGIPLGINRYPMISGNGWREFLNAGFKALKPVPVSP